ncbi:MAG TPA: mobilization protein [Gammaproteobacteria bacterium]|nr:mobilization protein [Gammaproteobacteria bacterium]
MRNETKEDGKNSASETSTKPGLEKLKAQRQKLDVRIQKMEAMGKSQARKQDVRRKILIGAYYLSQAIKDGTVPALRETMNVFLTRESDKKLFWDFEG